MSSFCPFNRIPLGRIIAFWLALAVWAPGHAGPARQEPLDVGIVNQRSVVLIAESWNPILGYVAEKAGVPLRLKIGRTAPETTAMTERGEHAFAFTNHMFTPERERIGYKVILRMAGEPIQGVLVVREDSPLRSVEQLKGQRVAFPSPEAFVSYKVIMDHLKRNGIDVQASMHGNQEAAMSQLQFGQVAAAGVNQKILKEYLERESVRYRILWITEPYFDMAIMAHPALPEDVVRGVRDALAGMHQDPEGIKALQASAAALGLRKAWSFVPASDRDYDNYRKFYRNTVLK